MTTITKARSRSARFSWTPSRDFQLVTLVDEHCPYSRISETLETSVASVRLRCRKLGVSLIRSGLSVAMVGKKLGVSHSTVRDWIERGWLVAQPSGIGPARSGIMSRIVEYDAMLVFLEDKTYWRCWNPLKVTDPDLGAWAREMRAGVWFLSTAEVSRLVHIGQRVIQQRCADGRIPAMRLRNRWLIRVSDLDTVALSIGSEDTQYRRREPCS